MDPILLKPRITEGDIFDTSADLMVIARSYVGSISSTFAQGLSKLGIKPPVKKSDLGSIEIESVITKDKQIQMLCYATSTGDGDVRAAIQHIGRSLGEFAFNNRLRSISAPLLGSGYGGLPPLEALSLFSTSFFETAEIDTELTICILNKAYHKMIREQIPEKPEVVLDYSPTVESAIRNLQSLKDCSAFQIVNEILKDHSNYEHVSITNFSSELIGKLETGRRASIDAWIDDIKKILKSDDVFVHGRFLIIALAILEPLLSDFLNSFGLLTRFGDKLKENWFLDSIFTSEAYARLQTIYKPSNPEGWFNKMLNNDIWAQEDRLGYELYATAICEMIREDSNQTRPPLTIAILAPWGQGKTTLMRYVERTFKKLNTISSEKIEESLTNETKEEEPKLKKLIKRLKQKLTFGTKSNVKDNQVKETTIKNLIEWVKEMPRINAKLNYPTIWFNPWKHQNGEQLWAGLGYSIIKQLVNYLPPADQEKFWFTLNLKRVDQHTLRNKIYKNIITEFIGTISTVLIIYSVLLLFIIIGLMVLAVISTRGVITGFGGIFLPYMFNFLIAKRKVMKESLKDKLSDIVSEPDYQKKSGFFVEVEKDMKYVFDILIDEKKPAIIFIDDLDRCSPDIVAEVIEAINLIVNSDFCEKCYFIIGMDAKMVAASLDKKYSGLVDKFEDEKNRFGDIGYYFLDKFIQLPFSLPSLNDVTRLSLLNNLFHTNYSKSEHGQKLNQEEKNVIDEFTMAESKSNVTEASRLIRERPQARERFLQNKIKKTLNDSEEIINQLVNFAPYLGSSPRTIKRFVNMYRFYYSYQELRKIEGKPYSTSSSLAKWLVLSIRCPQIVRFVQWEFEENFVNSSDPKVKAGKLDKMINEFKKELNGNSKISDGDVVKWKNKIDDLKIKDFNWLKESDILDIMVTYSDNESSFVKALECNVW